MRQLRHPDLGVTHRSGGVAIDGAKVALTIHQRVAQRERLRHTDDGVVNRRVPVRVVFTNNVTYHTRRLFIGLVPVVIQLVHGEQDTTVDWF